MAYPYISPKLVICWKSGNSAACVINLSAQDIPTNLSQDLDMIIRYDCPIFVVVYQVHSECSVITPEYSMPVGGALYKSGIVDMITLQ